MGKKKPRRANADLKNSGDKSNAELSRTPQASVPADTASPLLRPRVSESPMQSVLTEFRLYLQKKTSIPKIAKTLKMGQGKVRSLLRKAYREGAIIVRTAENKKLRGQLGQAWGGPTYHVLNAEDAAAFFRGAADVFFQELNQLIRKRPQGRPLHIGIVSGQTTGGMVEVLYHASWKNRFQSDRLPKDINVYALNASQTNSYEELQGNANVLALELTRKLRKVLGESHSVKVLGLSTNVLQARDEARLTDIHPHTQKVLMHTDPVRLRASLEADNQQIQSDIPSTTELDIVITGVGSIKDSLFRTYCEEYKFDLKLALDDGIVGDIAYCPVDRYGKPRVLRKDNKEYEFYSAVSLNVLTELSKSSDKKVILLARNSAASNKVEPIHAAIGGEHQHCNVLVTDHVTAKELIGHYG
jgi:DNA-binding transcriptional regulator LsrR (DeoR family)